MANPSDDCGILKSFNQNHSDDISSADKYQLFLSEKADEHGILQTSWNLRNNIWDCTYIFK